MPDLRRLILALFIAACLPGAARAAELADARKLFDTGKYAECIDACAKGIEANRWEEGWWLLKIRAELTVGRYPGAFTTYQDSLLRFATSLPIRLAGYDALLANGRTAEAVQVVATMREMADRIPQRYADAPNRVALGRAMLRSGADARQVLELFYDKAKADSPTSAEPFLASGELALEKHDYALAAEAFQEAVKRAGDDPDAYLGLARAFDNDSERATIALAKALELNPRHVGSLLFQADNLIDREEYAQAETVLREVLGINPWQPRAWAYRAVLAHIGGEAEKEKAHHAAALNPWSDNPEVDHLIGQKLSQKYRFAEGAAYQRLALRSSPTYRPARVQLCQDLLRLGQEDEGWKLADAVFKEDQYNVVAYNLVTLHDNLSKFRTLQNDHFLLRMEQRESQVYGQRALRLLERAREVLCKKYAVELPERVTVEIFPEQKDFAIRTFGLPGGAGFLGVCFGPVVTVNSPASRGAHPSNWEAVLWHEFCHTVTLHKTKNKMPRWLSEGISVYEERQAVPFWGEALNPAYRDFILKGEATPVSKLSGAFLKPPSPMHLQFAYYESSMVVEYVIGRFGTTALQNVLTDLGKAVPINDALAKHTEQIDKLDDAFAKWLRTQAEQLAPKSGWERPKLPPEAGSVAFGAWNKDNPNQFWGLLAEGQALVAEQKYQQAKAPLEKAAELFPSFADAGGPYPLLAEAHRGLGERVAERDALQKFTALSADAVEPRLRLMEMGAEDRDWNMVRKLAEETLGINPLVAAPHRRLAEAAAALAERPLAIEARRTLLLLDPLDPAEQHYQLAKLLSDDRQLPEARREVLQALEEAPRYRAAHTLLLEIVDKAGPTTRPTPAPATTPTMPPARPAVTQPAAPSPTREVQP